MFIIIKLMGGRLWNLKNAISAETKGRIKVILVGENLGF
jgi:hypothetical protein